MATRVIMKNPSAVSFKAKTVLGVKSVTLGVSSDVDRSRADNESNAIVFGVQNQTVTAEIEAGDLNDVVKAWSVGDVGAFSASSSTKYGSTSISVQVLTMYCEAIDIDLTHGEEATCRATFSGNPPVTWTNS